MEEKGLTVADALALRNGGDSNDMFGNNGAWWIIIFILFFAFGGRGFGYGGTMGGVSDGYTLASDFSNIERKIDGVNNGLCDGFYAQNTNMLTGFDRVTNNTNQGFAGLNTAIVTQGYDTRNAIQQNAIAAMQSANAIQSQIASCCCDTREAISNVNYNIATNANALSNTIQNTGFNTERQIERGFCDTNYNLATQNTTTLQAIDKVGDRIIDYLANEKVQTLRDENQALRLAASQQAQNTYLISQLSQPCPKPAYIVCNPNTPVNYPTSTCNCM